MCRKNQPPTGSRILVDYAYYGIQIAVAFLEEESAQLIQVCRSSIQSLPPTPRRRKVLGSSALRLGTWASDGIGKTAGASWQKLVERAAVFNNRLFEYLRRRFP